MLDLTFDVDDLVLDELAVTSMQDAGTLPKSDVIGSSCSCASCSCCCCSETN